MAASFEQQPPSEEGKSLQMISIVTVPAPPIAAEVAEARLCMHNLTTNVDRLHAKMHTWSRQASVQGPHAHAHLSFLSGNASWLHHHDEVATVSARFGPSSWQVSAVHFIHSHRVQFMLSVLLMIDVAAVFMELFLEAHYPECHLIKRDALSCCSAGSPGEITRRLGDHSLHGICDAGLKPNAQWSAGCDSHKYPTVHVLHEVCWYVTLVVLSIFLVELLVLVAALRKGFFKNRLYMLDLAIVVGTLALEWFHQSDLVHMCDPAELMILARCWRFVRVGHGLVVETHERGEKEVEQMRKHCQEMAQKIQGLQSRLEAEHGRKGHRLS